VVPQVYELWFKQVLFEVNSVIEIFNQEYVCQLKWWITSLLRLTSAALTSFASFVPEQQVFVAVRRLERVTGAFFAQLVAPPGLCSLLLVVLLLTLCRGRSQRSNASCWTK